MKTSAIGFRETATILSARLYGIFFILSFVAYAIGTGLVEIVQNPQTLPKEIVENRIGLITGGVLTVIFHTLANLCLIVIMFNVVKATSHTLSTIYLVLGVFATFMLAVGAVFLLLPLPVSEAIVRSGNADLSFFSSVLNLSAGGNFYSYQTGMFVWGLGGIVLCYLLYRSKLAPGLFPVWGCMGYLTFMAGCILELSGIPYGVAFSVPGGLFEISLSVWLIVKGFNNTAVIRKFSD